MNKNKYKFSKNSAAFCSKIYSYQEILTIYFEGDSRMYCNVCGTNLPDETRFCTNCGAPTHAVKTEKGERIPEDIIKARQETAAAVSLSRSDLIQTKKKTAVSPVLIPVMSLLLVGGGMTTYYNYETNINTKVLTMKHSAEELALQGEYTKAYHKLSDALKLRPNYAVLQENLEIVKTAEGYAKLLELVNTKIKENDFSSAEKELEHIKQQMNTSHGSIYDSLKQELSAKEVSVKIGKIKTEIDQLHDVSALGDKLFVVSTLSSKEGEAVKEQITNKVVQISSEEAAKLIKDKQFSQAIITVENGLKYALNHQKLLALKEKITQERLAFEQAEQDRLEKALKIAEADELKNNTAAIDIVDMNVLIDEFGDLYISGKVKNVATTSVYSITIEYALYDGKGNHYTDGATNVYPYHLDVGEDGTFEDIHYGVDEEVTVKITNITWYLE